MSESVEAKPKREHGTTSSYIIGFLLSLIFTLIPYYLVTEKLMSGKALLTTILIFAVLQMLVQVLFFLHLGREKRPHWQALFLISTVGIILVVVGGSIFIMNNLHYGMSPSDKSKKLAEGEGIYQIGGEKTGACQGQHTNHKVVIRDGQAFPGHIEALYCDTLTFINEDDVVRKITFGTHAEHVKYAGVYSLTVRSRDKTIILNQSGTYLFHDHNNPDTTGSFTVAPQ